MSKITQAFTKQQIQNWRDYEDVRQSGAYNMLDPRARRDTGLSSEEYLFVMEKYVALKTAAES